MKKTMKKICMFIAAMLLAALTCAGACPAEEKTLPQEKAVLEGINFVLFGLSGESAADTGRSDTIMICTINKETKTMKLTSILRDTKAQIKGHEPQKINAAYRYGGASLAMETLNENFNLSLSQYITVKFETLEKIVDTLGGVEMELTAEEARVINGECEGNLSAGLNLLNGEQALAYSRIRKIDSDKIRAQRQQKVIEQIFEKVRSAGFLQLMTIAWDLVTTSEISMTLDDIVGVLLLPLGEYEIVKNVVPDIEIDTDLRTEIDEHGEWVWIYDTKKAGERIVEFINGSSVSEK